MGLRWRNLIFISTSGVLLAVMCRVKFLQLPALTLLDFDPKSCPFCFGRSFCNEMQYVSIRLNLIDVIVGYINRKYVYAGSFKGDSVVIKSLATDTDLKVLDATVHSLAKSNDLRHINWLNKCLHLLNSSFANASYKLRVCPGLENINNLLSRFIAFIRDFESKEYVYANLWTNLFLNPEPLLLTILNKDEGWPVAKYFGSCGRFAIVEYCGKPIQDYVNHPWLFRVHIFSELLRMALQFTFSSDKFAVYFRDISRTNIVVDNSLKTRIVDLEHIIIVDKSPLEQNRPKVWNSTHHSIHFECNDCLTYSPLQICSHHISDHNVYAVCKKFAHDFSSNELGLLHSPPQQKYISSVVDKLKYFTSECVSPMGNHTRIKIAQNFVDFLEELKRTMNFNRFDYIKLL